MLKKAGIVVAAAAAGLLAVSPLAFAGDKGGSSGSGGQADTASAVVSDDDNVNSAKDESFRNAGLVNVSDNEINVPVQVCKNNIVSNINAALGVLDILAGAQTVGPNDQSQAGDCSQENSSGDSLTQVIAK